jgi:hypothetical protein
VQKTFVAYLMLAVQGTGLRVQVTITVICAVGAFMFPITVTTIVRIELYYTAVGDNSSLYHY